MPSDGVPFSVNVDSPVAVYEQIENQVMFAVASGRLKPGERLPSVRELSNGLRINPNTITKAYRDLELRRLVASRRGVGVTVTGEAAEICAREAPSLAIGRLREAAADCAACGISVTEARRILGESMNGK